MEKISQAPHSCILHTSGSDEDPGVGLTKVKDIASWKSLLEAAHVRGFEPVLKVAENLGTGEKEQQLRDSFGMDLVYAISHGKVKTSKHIVLAFAVKSLTGQDGGITPGQVKPYVPTALAWDNIDRLEETLTGCGTSHRVNENTQLNLLLKKTSKENTELNLHLENVIQEKRQLDVENQKLNMFLNSTLENFNLIKEENKQLNLHPEDEDQNLQVMTPAVV
ncbi:hypothetical protein D5F01_LYC13837 [Larimichthys crocea]|uniref:Uncharacterized protein n=1 Tax=Larimichthys crocea TaxID=215358 RepID=A0A6G0I8L9_LARCR|nr:hypothetical protein D5F01_LYC13837 [Larimichthys crocea]